MTGTMYAMTEDGDELGSDVEEPDWFPCQIAANLLVGTACRCRMRPQLVASVVESHGEGSSPFWTSE